MAQIRHLQENQKNVQSHGTEIEIHQIYSAYASSNSHSPWSQNSNTQLVNPLWNACNWSLIFICFFKSAVKWSTRKSLTISNMTLLSNKCFRKRISVTSPLKSKALKVLGQDLKHGDTIFNTQSLSGWKAHLTSNIQNQAIQKLHVWTLKTYHKNLKRFQNRCFFEKVDYHISSVCRHPTLKLHQIMKSRKAVLSFR